MKIGFDLDGVIADIDFFKLRTVDFERDQKIKKELEYWYYASRRLLLNPDTFKLDNDEVIIITTRASVTGNNIRKLTEDWLKYQNVHYDRLYFVPVPQGQYIGQSLQEWYRRMAEEKAKIINREGLDVYFEDSPEVARYLRLLCPNTKIIRFGV